MKKITRILLALCLVIFTVSAVACRKDNIDDYEESIDIPTSLPEVTETPEGEETNDAYINAAPANDEQGWGALTPRPGK